MSSCIHGLESPAAVQADSANSPVRDWGGKIPCSRLLARQSVAKEPPLDELIAVSEDWPSLMILSVMSDEEKGKF